MASTSIIDIRKQPFYSWQCLTIHTKKKDIDLVIPNEECMNLVLKFLIHYMNTMDGTRNSAKPMKQLLLKQRIKNLPIPLQT